MIKKNKMIKKNIRIILLSVAGYDLDKQDLERIQGEKFTHRALAQYELFNRAFPCDTEVKVMTPAEFKDFHSRSKKINKDFDIAMKCMGTHCNYGLSEFMDDYNNQIYKGKTEKYWFGYVQVK